MFGGLIGIIDPPRVEAKDTVVRAKHAGIRPIKITATSVIARELGISVDGRAATRAEVEKLSPDALARTADGRVRLR